MQLRVATACCVFLAVLACGDDEDDRSAADGGKDSGTSEPPRAGRGGGGAGGKGGSGGTGGSGGEGGAKPEAGSGGMSVNADDAGASDLQSVTIRFQAKFGERDLHCGETYTLPSLGAAQVSPADFRFFVQEVRLVTASGHEEPVVFDDRAPVQTRDVALIDFTDDSGQCGAGTSAPNTTITGKVAPGTYRKIIFVNGVPESVNHLDLADAKPPLNDATTHWGWTNGYRFSLSGVTVDPGDAADADGGTAEGSSFVHVGAGGCAGSPNNGFTCSRPNRSRVVLDDFDPEKNVIAADLARVFGDVDLSKPLECHGPSSPACGPAYTALGLNAADGTARDTQRVYHVE